MRKLPLTSRMTEDTSEIIPLPGRRDFTPLPTKNCKSEPTSQIPIFPGALAWCTNKTSQNISRISTHRGRVAPGPDVTGFKLVFPKTHHIGPRKDAPTAKINTSKTIQQRAQSPAPPASERAAGRERGNHRAAAASASARATPGIDLKPAMGQSLLLAATPATKRRVASGYGKQRRVLAEHPKQLDHCEQGLCRGQPAKPSGPEKKRVRMLSTFTPFNCSGARKRTLQNKITAYLLP